MIFSRYILLITLIIFVLPECIVWSAPIDRGRQIALFASVSEADGRLIPQAGVRIFQQKDGCFYGVLIKNGFDQYDFSGDSHADKLLQGAFDGISMNVTDWNTYLKTTIRTIKAKHGIGIAVLDGSDYVIEVNYQGKEVKLHFSNAPIYVRHAAKYDPCFATLNAVLDQVSLYFARSQLGM